MASQPIVKLITNPWRGSLGDEAVLMFLNTAAIEAQMNLQEMIAKEEVENGRDSFGAVFLNPVRPRYCYAVSDLVLATIAIGPEGTRYIPNAAAKADAHERHGVPNGPLVESSNFCLGDEDFAYGTSSEYMKSIAGGSGLSPEQDGALVLRMQQRFFDAVHNARVNWLAQQRQLNSGWRWFNDSDKPGADYQLIADLHPIAQLGG